MAEAVLSSFSNFVGVDVGSERLDVHVLPVRKSFVVANDEDGWKGLVTELSSVVKQEVGETLVVLEATGGYERRAALTLEAAGFRVSVVNPRRARDFAKGQGVRAKTDKLDARMLASFAMKGDVVPRRLPDEKQRLLDDLVRRRGNLVEMRTMEENRGRMPENEFVQTSQQAHLAFLDGQIKEIELEIEKFISSNEEMKARNELVQSVPCVGPCTARELLAGLPELGSASRREIVALAGLAPYTHDSGKHMGKREIGGGRFYLRRALFMAVVSGVRLNSVIREFYLRLKDSGKPTKVAMVACMRKLLLILNAMVRDGKPWQQGGVGCVPGAPGGQGVS
jgi:transposase